jgi:hypothetical protein
MNKIAALPASQSGMPLANFAAYHVAFPYRSRGLPLKTGDFGAQ